MIANVRNLMHSVDPDAKVNTSVAHLTSVHPQFDVRIFHKECLALSREGYQVTLISAGGDNGAVGGVRMLAVAAPRNRVERLTRTVFQIYRAALREGADVCHFHDPELIPAALLLKLQGKRVIYDVHENLPLQVLTKPWIPNSLRPIVAKAAGAVEAIGGRLFDGIVAATPTIARRFPTRKTATVHNFPQAEEFAGGCLHPYGQRSPLIAYVGGITAIRGIREVVEAMGQLPESLGARLALAGTFSPIELEQEIRKMQGWRSVRYAGWQSRQEVASLLCQARIGLALLHPTPSYLRSYPIKLFEYMAAGIPVIVSDFPLWREIVDNARCGLLVDPLRPAEIAAAVCWLLEHPIEAETMGQQGLNAVRERYNWETEATKLLELYRRVAGKRR